MTWSKRAVLAVAMVLPLASPAFAQVIGHTIDISGGAGLMDFDTRARIRDAAAYGGALGVRLTPWVTFEASALLALSESKVNPAFDHNFGYAGGDLRWNLRQAHSKVVPFLLTGVGYGGSHSSARDPVKVDGVAGSGGVGLLYNLGNPRTYLRFQVRDVWMRDRTLELTNDFAVTAGLHYVLGGKYRDQDLDGVRDWLDRCPNTPIGAKVDANGCPTDAERDSVFDGIDQCPDTPFGCKVDKKGCPIDTDGDGVCDGLDQCADTPKGATVDAKGCPKDSDGDGVLDGLDQCPNTPKGAEVDEKGCPKDDDGDGVPNGIDQCAGTPAGMPVDAKGCVTEAGKREVELMDTGTIRLLNIGFESGKSDIPDDFKPTLDAVAQVLKGWPDLKVEIGGHTDSQGGAAANRRLSQARAQAVLDYLMAKDPDLNAERFTVKGYGSTRPIAPNTTPAGMALNRRVEFVVLDKQAFKQEIERRRHPEGSAPADTTK